MVSASRIYAATNDMPVGATLDGGGPAVFSLTLSDQLLKDVTFKYDESTGEGSAVIPRSSLANLGQHTITVVATNSAASKSQAEATILVLPTLGTVSLAINPAEAAPNQTITFTLLVQKAGHYNVTIDYGDGFIDTSTVDKDMVTAYPMTFTHKYTSIGSHNVSATVEDGLEIANGDGKVTIAGRLDRRPYLILFFKPP